MIKADSLQNERILVVGDLMLDRFWWGEVTRISPEAPVPVVSLQTTTDTLGGAANVAANIAGLGCTPILAGCVGEDGDGTRLVSLLSDEHLNDTCVIAVKGRSTTSKTRIVARGQHIVRVDREVNDPIDSEAESKLIGLIAGVINSVKCIVVSDYAKGTLTPRLLESIFSSATELGVPIFVDPKGTDINKYRGATLLTPNRREALEAAGVLHDSKSAVYEAGDILLDRMPGTSILITEGENGMTLFESGSEPFHIDTTARDVFDVTGAGDTVAAATAVATANGYDLRDAIVFANEAAGLAVEHIGTTKVTLRMFATANSAPREASRNV